MIFPTIQELSQDKFNRYEIALATAKCARLVTNEYVHQRNEAEASQTGNKETDKPLNTMIDKELRDEKAVKIAIGRLYNHEYVITEMSPEEQEKAERAVLDGPERPEVDPDDIVIPEDEDDDEAAADAAGAAEADADADADIEDSDDADDKTDEEAETDGEADGETDTPADAE